MSGLSRRWRLVRDEPYWIPLPTGMRSGIWRIRLYAHGPDQLTAVVTEPDDADGPSITNCAEDVYRDLATRFPQHRVRLIEHYPDTLGGEDDRFDLVSVVDGRAQWRHIPLATMVREYGIEVLSTPLP